MTASKYIAESTRVVVQNGKRKVLCTKGDVISEKKWNTLSDKVKVFFKPVEPSEDSNQPENITVDYPAGMTTERYETMKQMMAEQEGMVKSANLTLGEGLTPGTSLNIIMSGSKSFIKKPAK